MSEFLNNYQQTIIYFAICSAFLTRAQLFLLWQTELLCSSWDGLLKASYSFRFVLHLEALALNQLLLATGCENILV